MSKYVKELEDIISDILLPAYIENCRTKGVKPLTGAILSRLIKAKRAEVKCALLDGVE